MPPSPAAVRRIVPENGSDTDSGRSPTVAGHWGSARSARAGPGASTTRTARTASAMTAASRRPRPWEAGAMPHPLDPLTAEEIVRVAGAVRARATEADLLFSSITLVEPSKASLEAHRQGDPLVRAAKAVVLDGAHGVIEAVVAVEEAEVTSWSPVPDVRPPLLFTEAFNAMEAVRA